MIDRSKLQVNSFKFRVKFKDLQWIWITRFVVKAKLIKLTIWKRSGHSSLVIPILTVIQQAGNIAEIWQWMKTSTPNKGVHGVDFSWLDMEDGLKAF